MDTGPVRIYTTKDTPRLRYISALILGEILGLKWEITTDKRKTRKQPVINYSGENIAGAFNIKPDQLLFENDLRARDITVTSWRSLPVFFTSENGSDFPFDIFAASFYLVSRYEEYPEGERDEHGRFRASSSIAFKNGFLSKPVVDLWAMEFARAIIRKFRNIAVRRNEFRSLLTIDADQPYAYLGKNLFESIGGIVDDWRSSRLNFSKRYRAVTQAEKDPFDVFDYIIGAINKSSASVRFFFPVGDHSGYDRNPSWKKEVYRKLIEKISSRFSTGLHPSYNSAFEKNLIKAEKERFKSITGRNTDASRFHYLRFRLPDSYRYVIENGITGDYSMGYSDEPGFRAGISRPYYFFDILKDQQTELMIFPFQIMDETIFGSKKMDRETARQLIQEMIDSVKKVGGTFISIWHNTSLLEDEQGRAGRELFEFMLNQQIYDSLS